MTNAMFALNQSQLNKLGFWMLMLAGAVLAMMVPELAFAEGEGQAGLWSAGADEIRQASDESFRAWWEVASTWMLWIGLGVLGATVIFFKGTGWWLALVIWAIAAWGDKIVDWVSAL